MVLPVFDLSVIQPEADTMQFSCWADTHQTPGIDCRQSAEATQTSPFGNITSISHQRKPPMNGHAEKSDRHEAPRACQNRLCHFDLKSTQHAVFVTINANMGAN